MGGGGASGGGSGNPCDFTSCGVVSTAGSRLGVGVIIVVRTVPGMEVVVQVVVATVVLALVVLGVDVVVTVARVVVLRVDAAVVVVIVLVVAVDVLVVVEVGGNVAVVVVESSEALYDEIPKGACVVPVGIKVGSGVDRRIRLRVGLRGSVVGAAPVGQETRHLKIPSGSLKQSS